MTEPLLPPEVDLRDFPYMPMHIARLFNSEFHAKANDAEWRAGVTLWLKAFQLPGTGLPDDDVALARLAEYGRDVKGWQKVKAMALYGWQKCSDGRWYHPVVAEVAHQAWLRKIAQRERTEKARQARHKTKATEDAKAIVTRPVTVSVTEPATEPMADAKGREEKGREAALSSTTLDSERPDSGSLQVRDSGVLRIGQRRHGRVDYSDPANRNAYADQKVAAILASRTNEPDAWMTIFAARDPNDPNHETARRECELIARSISVTWDAARGAA